MQKMINSAKNTLAKAGNNPIASKITNGIGSANAFKSILDQFQQIGQGKTGWERIQSIAKIVASIMGMA